ncbi:protein-tyrosine phosphatase-like protein [Hysterangium stoloniferum]|nr:protein-tyrosine phosphatase-like protein [Hysterangium stoloniferum]
MDDFDLESVKTQISAPPFVTIDGVSNVRTLGDYPSTTYPGQLTKPNFAFRAAEVSGITALGKAQLESLGIKKVFDLRSDIELEKFGTPVPELTAHIEILRVPVFKKEDYSPEMVARRYRLYASGKTEAFMELYSQILDNAIMAYGTIFKHIRDHPNEAFIFHCTAGKDRTGVLAALILKLSGVDNETIVRDYSLTLVGRALQREMIMERLSKEPIFAENKEAAFNLLSSRHETMIAFLDMLEEKYGGIEKYLSEYLGFSRDDITTIRHNILVQANL